MSLWDEIDKVRFVAWINDYCIAQHRGLTIRVRFLDYESKTTALVFPTLKGPLILCSRNMPMNKLESAIAHEFAEVIYPNFGKRNKEEKKESHQYALECEGIYNKKFPYKINKV